MIVSFIEDLLIFFTFAVSLKLNDKKLTGVTSKLTGVTSKLRGVTSKLTGVTS